MKIVILGTGSTAQSIASIILSNRDFQVVGFTSNKREEGKLILGVKVIGTHDILADLFRQGVRGAVAAVGYDNKIREKYFYELKDIGFELINVVHHSALIDQSAEIGEGVVIGPGSIILPMVKIGRNTQLEAGVIVGANAQIGDNVYIGIGCNISGASCIKRNAFLSPGCSIAPLVTVGKNAKVAPAASVTKNIPDRVRGEK